MSISSLPVAKFQFPWAPEEERDPRDRKQVAALTAALQASLARESVSRQGNVELLQRQHTLALEFEQAHHLRKPGAAAPKMPKKTRKTRSRK